MMEVKCLSPHFWVCNMEHNLLFYNNAIIVRKQVRNSTDIYLFGGFSLLLGVLVNHYITMYMFIPCRHNLIVPACSLAFLPKLALSIELNILNVHTRNSFVIDSVILLILDSL